MEAWSVNMMRNFPQTELWSNKTEMDSSPSIFISNSSLAENKFGRDTRLI